MDRSTGQPLRGVHVRMITGDFGGNSGITAVYGSTSDAAGHFSAAGVKPGIYMVLAERKGFVQMPASQGSPLAIDLLTVKAGQHITDHKLEMTPRALIAGRVVDENGDPVDNVNISVQAVPPEHLLQSPFGNSNATTDDRGEFHLLTAPGKYYVWAAVQNRGPGRPEVRTDGTSAALNASTYYPSAANAASASPVQVAPGQDLSGIEIRLIHSTATGAPSSRGFTISGIVTGAPANAQAAVMLRYGPAAGQFNNSRSTTSGPDGKFTFTGMEPGVYSAVALYAAGKTSLQSRPVEFHLADADETSLQLALAPGEDLTGTLQFVGDAPAGAGAAEKHTVRLESADRMNFTGQAEPPAVEVGKDGTFRITSVPPGKFKPVVEPMPENAYVKEVSLDGKPAADAVLDLSQGAGGSRVKITVSRAGGQISGRILGKDGEPSASLLEVFLASDPKQIDDNNAKRDSDGKYSFSSIRPGKYRVFAIDVVELLPVLEGSDQTGFTKQFFDASEEIEIKEGDRIVKDITAFSKLPEKK